MTRTAMVKRMEIKADYSVTYAGRPISTWIEIEFDKHIGVLVLDPENDIEFIKTLNIGKTVKMTLEVVE